jgi:hypothetical protein
LPIVAALPPPPAGNSSGQRVDPLKNGKMNDLESSPDTSDLSSSAKILALQQLSAIEIFLLYHRLV